ncbi:hypothetical protein IL54_3084 [Sphingobium sp. ba1]|nr:hypothetical protein IL54_3084 [Sphingobium sp. ba1]
MRLTLFISRSSNTAIMATSAPG